MPERTISFKTILNASDMERKARRIQNLFKFKPVRIDDNLSTVSKNADKATRDLKELGDAAKRAEGDVKRLGSSGSGVGGIGAGLQSAIIGGAAGFLTIQSARRIAETGVAMSDLAAQSRRTGLAFELFSGGADQAAKNLQAVKDGAGGAIASLDAQGIAVGILNQKLAQTPQELQRVVEAARVSATISPVINDINQAIEQIVLASASQSTQRLDQIGVTATEVKKRVDELKKSRSDLSDQQIFAQAIVDSLVAKGGALINSTEAQATGVEELRVAWDEFTKPWP